MPSPTRSGPFSGRREANPDCFGIRRSKSWTIWRRNYLRKVRILNGLHTAMAAKFRPAGFETVLQVLSDRDAVRWLRALLYEEIVPTICYRVEDVAEFADQTFDRLRNPFLAHKLADIAMNHAAKVQVRLQPTRVDYEKIFGRPPKKLVEVLQAGTPLQGGN
ncbi:MAG: hypothetical protein ACM3U2_04705 [Deltaproteobacteria bacterium]